MTTNGCANVAIINRRDIFQNILLGTIMAVFGFIPFTANAQDSQVNQCPFQEKEGRIIVTINETLKSNAPHDTQNIVYETLIPQGTYAVSLASFDDHDSEIQDQSFESWHAVLQNDKGYSIATPDIEDIPQNNNTTTQVVSRQFQIDQTITQLIAIHATQCTALERSVEAVCAAFDNVNSASSTPYVSISSNQRIIQSGDGISQTLEKFYIEQLQLSNEEARAKMFDQLKNPLFFKDGLLQDLVHGGDIISFDETTGDVIEYETTSGYAVGRLKDVLAVNKSKNELIFGKDSIPLPEEIIVEIQKNPIDQHNNIILTDRDKISHTIIAYADGPDALVDGKKRNLMTWLEGPTVLGTTSLNTIDTITTDEEDTIKNEDEKEEETCSGLWFFPPLTSLPFPWCTYWPIVIALIIAAIYYYVTRGKEEEDPEPKPPSNL